MLNVLMDRSLPRQFIGLLSGWLAKVLSVSYSRWFQILASVRQGGIVSPILFAVYTDPHS